MYRALSVQSNRLAALLTGGSAFAGAYFALGQSSSHASDASHPAAFSPQEWRPFKLVERRDVSHNTVFLRFAFRQEDHTAGLPVASCIIVRAPIGKEKEDGSKGYIIRPYTPVSPPDSLGHFDLVVKSYPEGNMSKHLGSLREGDELECKGPIMKLPYEANMKKQVGMIAGGTGITPMLQVVEEVLRHDNDKTAVSLVYANRTPNDILLKDRLDELAAKHSNFKVHYVVDKTEGWLGGLTWRGSTGFVTEDIVKQHLPAPSNDSLIMVCGPPPMMNAVSGDKAPDKTQGELSGVLAKMGYERENVFKF